MKFTTYILHSTAIDKYYIGSTSLSMEKRLYNHTLNHKGFTGRAKDWKVVFTDYFSTIQKARAREGQIKKRKSRRMIETLIKSRN